MMKIRGKAERSQTVKWKWSLALGLLCASVGISSTAVAQDSYEDRQERGRRSSERYESDGADGREQFSTSVAGYGIAWDAEDDAGWGAGGKIDVRFMELLSVEARGGWVDDVEVGHSGAELDLVPLDLGVAIHMPTTWLSDDREIPIRPFAMGGASYVFVDSSGDFEGDDEAGWYAGGGVEIGQRRGLGLLLEVFYRGVEIELDSDTPGADTDAEVDGVNAHAGLYYRW